MMERFTDYARGAVGRAFGRSPVASERIVVTALVRRGVASRLVERAGVSIADLPADEPAVERLAVVAEAVVEARRRGVAYVGTEHLLIAVARQPGSALAAAGATADRLDALLTVVEGEGRRSSPPVVRWLASAGRRFGRWVRGS